MQTKNKVTIPKLQSMKKEEQKIACLTAYDWLLASLLDKAGIDLVLVGDSGAMVFAGHKTTLPVTMDQMIYHTQAVSRGVRNGLLVVDMPFMSFQVNTDDTIKNAGRFLKEAGAEAVKLEGGESIAETIDKLVSMGIPVMGHLGLTPQSIRNFGGYRIRGKNDTEAKELKQDAKILEQAGAFAVVLEKIPSELAREITTSIAIPTIGIGAGPYCDGQILVTHDILGLFEEFKPKFVRHYANLAENITESVKQYISDVKGKTYPSAEESY